MFKPSKLVELKRNVKRTFKVGRALTSDAPKSNTPFITWLDDEVLDRFEAHLPPDAKYLDLRNDYAAFKSMFSAIIAQDPYYEHAMMAVIQLIRDAPAPPLSSQERTWLEQHYGLKLPREVAK